MNSVEVVTDKEDSLDSASAAAAGVIDGAAASMPLHALARETPSIWQNITTVSPAREVQSQGELESVLHMQVSPSAKLRSGVPQNALKENSFELAGASMEGCPWDSNPIMPSGGQRACVWKHSPPAAASGCWPRGARVWAMYSDARGSEIPVHDSDSPAHEAPSGPHHDPSWWQSSICSRTRPGTCCCHSGR